MRLLESIPWQAEVIDAPPVRLGYESIDVPADLDVTYIGVLHHMIGGIPDYMRGALEEADVLVQEAPGWSRKFARQLQEVANGSYTALKQSIEEAEEHRQHNPGVGEWNEFYFRQLYDSGVRVVLADYPKEHPKVEEERRLLNGGLVKDRGAAHNIFAQRDKYMLTSMVEKIHELRSKVPDIQAKSPLRVLMLFGAAHYAVHDALAAAAEEKDIASFSSRLLFQESADLVVDFGPPELQALSRQLATEYQNWLRTPAD